MKTLGKLMMIGAISSLMLTSGVTAVSGQDDEAAGEETKQYWLGIYGVPASDLLKAQLGIDQGVVLQDLVPDGPAAESGLKKFDIILEFGGKPVGDLRDIAEIMKDNQGEKISTDLLRNGKRKVIDVKPGVRPENLGRGVPGFEREHDRIMRWMEKLRKGQLDDDPLRMLLVKPGVILPHEHFNLNVPGMMLKEFGLPEDCSITITKKGTEPAEITVRVSGQEWKTTEDEIKSLPEKIRPWVESWMNNRGAYRITPKAVPRAEVDRARRRIEEMRERLQGNKDPFKDLREQIEAMRREIEQLRKEKAADSQPGEDVEA